MSEERIRRAAPWFRALIVAPVLSGCASAARLPEPRSLVVRSGARLRPDRGRVEQIDRWVQEETTNIEEDPSFYIITNATNQEVYPWEGFEINAAADTATVFLLGSAPDARRPFEIYAHLHLMQRVNRLEEWAPEAVGLEGYELERAILSRVADAWLYGRSVFDLAPYGPLDELMFAKEHGYLDAFILTARADEFRESRGDWLDENPGGTSEYRTWFRETFEKDPKGLR